MIFPSNLKVFIAVESVDMRKAISGLSILVSSQLQLDLYSNQLFVFSNKRNNIIKILYWDRNGFCIWQKRLEKGRFLWPKSKNDVLIASQRELNWLLDGLNFQALKAHKKLNFSASY